VLGREFSTDPFLLSRTWTDRQRLVALTWLRMELNNPSRADLYAMQIACEVRRVLAKNPSGIKIKDFLLTTSDRQTTQQSPPSDPALTLQKAEMAKSLWRMRLKEVGYVEQRPDGSQQQRLPKQTKTPAPTPLASPRETRGRRRKQAREQPSQQPLGKVPRPSAQE
jgi:hypothetical protein